MRTTTNKTKKNTKEQKIITQSKIITTETTSNKETQII
jgi:hypothetical protein